LLSNQSFAASFPFITVIPQCPGECAMANHWLPSTLQAITATLHEWVLTADGGLGGDRSRTYLAGQSMGGEAARSRSDGRPTDRNAPRDVQRACACASASASASASAGHGAWTYAAQQPRLFAGMVVVCGYMQGSDEERAVSERLARGRLAVAVVHAANDVVIPVQASDQAVAALRVAGFPRGSAAAADGARRGGLALRYDRYESAPGPPMPEFASLLGHGAYEIAFRDGTLYAWLLQHTCQRCGARPPAAWSPLATAREGEDELRRT
jgi:hypothetical protein